MPTQARYLSYIHAYAVGFGVPPAESEIASVLYANLRSMLDGCWDDERLDYHGISISDMMAKHGPPLRMCYEPSTLSF